MNKLTRIEIIGDEGRGVVQYAPEGKHYMMMIQDDGRTLKFFEVEHEKHECHGVGKCQDQGCPAHYATVGDKDHWINRMDEDE
jgi:hypothetical protein